MSDRPEHPTEEAPARWVHAARRGVKTSHLILGAAAVLAALAAVAGGLRAADELATGHQLTSWRGGWHRGGPLGRICSDDRNNWLAERIELIEAFVTFTPEQQPAWQELTRAVDEASAKVGAACDQFENAGPPTTAPEHLERAELILATGFDVVQGLRPAIDGLYAVLEPEQRAALDRLARRRAAAD